MDGDTKTLQALFDTLDNPEQWVNPPITLQMKLRMIRFSGPNSPLEIANRKGKLEELEGKLMFMSNTFDKIPLIEDRISIPGSLVSYRPLISLERNKRKCILAIMLNKQGIPKNDCHKYKRSVDDIEATTGYGFPSKGPKSIQNIIEGKK